MDLANPVATVVKDVPEKKSAPCLELSDGTFLDHLRIYYYSLFPFKLFQRWLSYDGVQKNYFLFRELSFTLASDAYLRFQSFKDEEELKQEIWRLCPVKIDIGAVYNSKPKDRKSVKPAAFQPQERELVFDIDMTDYDEIRTCCSGASICLKCWDFMTISIKVLDSILREDFGFKHLLWVFSGRRGVHCWVCDESARKLPAEARRAIVSFIEVVKGGEQQSRKVNLPNHLHVSLLRSLRTVDAYFNKSILEKQAPLDDRSRWSKILQLISDEGIRNTLDARWAKDGGWSSRDRWGDLETEIAEATSKKASKRGGLHNVARDIKFQYTYPRLDDHVTTGLNHLLKAPFCIHPVGNVCVPIDPADCENFNPLTVPKLYDLVRQIDEFNAANPDSVGVPDYAKTSLKPHMERFENFVNALSEEQREKLRAQRTREDRMMNAQ
ncbi:prim-pol domain-containing protein [Gonapodya prolifera JEL478]|uniref:DNA primase n=1 Tax=Gonapodya prolifera (strain JEL478) TaxID=1344416 RepID=A0A139A6Z0_GONPJ|nr:prim-pol domain-containing protein [Gonapodya prolifera JEL478]|eukprot:KXS12541.1 prim-pol domain-containing protein [Gonapodya prolifera JEL478]